MVTLIDIYEELNRSPNRKQRLDEVTRKNLVGKTKYQSIGRYNRRKNYTVDTKYNIDVQKFISDDMIAITAHVGKYECTVAFEGVIENVVDIVQHRAHNNLTLADVYKALYRCIDAGDIYVNCTCADYQYRFRYWATRLGYQYGPGERRPAHITNPRNNIGSFCKHLTKLLADKSWLKRCSSVVNLILKDNIEEVRERFGLEEDELTVADTKLNLKQYRKKQEPVKEPEEAEEEEEETPVEEIEVEPEKSKEEEPEEDEEEDIGEDDISEPMKPTMN